MMRQILAVIFLGILITGCVATKPGKDRYSGFLSYEHYDNLGKVVVPSDEIVYRHINPEFDPEKYHHILVEPVVAYPEPRATERFSMETLLTLQTQITRLFEDQLSQIRPLAQSPGPGVITMQTAITGINISDKPLKPYEYVPVGLATAAASKAAGIRGQQVKLFMESRLIDSDTEKVMVVAIREVTGEDLKNVRERLQADKLNKGLEDVGMDMFQFTNSLFVKQ